MDRIMILDADGSADSISCEAKKQGGQMTEKEETVELSSEPMEEKTKKPHRGRAVAIIAVVVVAIIVVAGVFGFRAYSDAQYNNAVAACAAASENVRNATNDYNNLVNGDASEAAALTKKDVKDASTLDALNKELSVELPVYEGCVADDTAGFKSATAKLNEQADWYKAYTQSLQKAVDAVNASKK